MNLKDKFYIPPNDRKYAAIGGMLVVVCVLVFRLSGIDGQMPESKGSENEKHEMPYEKYNNGESVSYSKGNKEIELFDFDPNTADSTELLKLGLQPWMVRNIYKYRSAGGVYRKPTDFARLYGLTKKQYEMLAPYIHISDDYRPASDVYGNSGELYEVSDRHTDKPLSRDTLKYPYKLKSGEHIALNGSDTTQLKKIPGIGSSYANAICRYRERLGGFYSSNQLLEIDGIPESVVHYVAVDRSVIRKLNLNKLSYRQLRQHPYINFYQAKDIVDYRRLHGTLKSMSELKLLDSFTKEDIERLKYYVEF